MTGEQRGHVWTCADIAGACYGDGLYKIVLVAQTNPFTLPDTGDVIGGLYVCTPLYIFALRNSV